MRLEPMRVLSDDEVQSIHETSLNILSGCGVKVYNNNMLDFLKDRGLDVDRDKQIVRFTPSVIEDALSSIPKTFEVFGREGDFLYVLGEGRPGTMLSSGSIQIQVRPVVPPWQMLSCSRTYANSWSALI